MPRQATSAPSADNKPAARGKAGASPTRLVVLVATRKGAWLFHSDARRKTFSADGPHFLGHNISHMVLDPRDGRTLLAAAKTGHLGPTVFRSTDFGRHWKEARQPPAFAKPSNSLPARSVDHTFWLTSGHAGERDTWYAGTSPQGLFRSEDGGVSWAPLPSVNDDPQFREWMGTVQDGTPDGPEAALDHRRPARPGAPAVRHVRRRRARVARRRPQLEDADQGPGGGGGLRSDLGHLPRPALRAPVPEPARPAVPAEPLRHLPARRLGRCR